MEIASRPGLGGTRGRRGRSFGAALEGSQAVAITKRGGGWRRKRDGERSREFFIVFLEREGFLLIGVFFLGEGFADGAGVLAAEGHGDGLGDRDGLGVVVDHFDPGDALEGVPLAAAGEGEGDEDDEVGEASHGGY